MELILIAALGLVWGAQVVESRGRRRAAREVSRGNLINH